MTSQGRFARADQQLGAEAADGESQEVEALIEVDDTRLVLVEGQPPGRQPLCQICLDPFGLRLGSAQGDKIIGVADQHGRAQRRRTGTCAGELVADPSGPFHPV